VSPIAESRSRHTVSGGWDGGSMAWSGGAVWFVGPWERR
jgi:hypothetical protein